MCREGVKELLHKTNVMWNAEKVHDSADDSIYLYCYCKMAR